MKKNKSEQEVITTGEKDGLPNIKSHENEFNDS